MCANAAAARSSARRRASGCWPSPSMPTGSLTVSYTHLDVYKRQDLGRIKTQQAFLTAMVEQLLKLENITKVNEFARVFQENVETDLTFQNILWFAKSAYLGGLKMENVNFLTMPNKNVSCWSRSYHNYQSYVVPIAGELLDLVNHELSPFVETFALSDLDIMSVNADGSVSSSTGYVEDSKAARPPVKPSTPSTDDEPEEETPDTTPGTTDPGITDTRASRLSLVPDAA